MYAITFTVEKAPEGGFTAQAVGVSIFTDAGSLAELPGRLRDAARCHFGDEQVAITVSMPLETLD